MSDAVVSNLPAWQADYSQTALAARDASRRGALAAYMPDAEENESYASYLSRVPLKAGLLAEFVRASSPHATLPQLVLNGNLTAPGRDCCASRVCYADLAGTHTACRKSWLKAFQKYVPCQEQLEHAPGMLEPSQLADAASVSCPERNSRAANHSRTIGNSLVTQAVATLQSLDAGLLAHKLAWYERAIGGCPLSVRYRP